VATNNSDLTPKSSSSPEPSWPRASLATKIVKVVCHGIPKKPCGEVLLDGPPTPVSHGLCRQCELAFYEMDGVLTDDEAKELMSLRSRRTAKSGGKMGKDQDDFSDFVGRQLDTIESLAEELASLRKQYESDVRIQAVLRERGEVMKLKRALAVSKESKSDEIKYSNRLCAKLEEQAREIKRLRGALDVKYADVRESGVLISRLEWDRQQAAIRGEGGE